MSMMCILMNRNGYSVLTRAKSQSIRAELDFFSIFLKNQLTNFGCTGSSLLCMGFSMWCLLLWQSTGSRLADFLSCIAQTELPQGMWNLPGAGIEPVSSALAGGFLTTGPPEKSL